MNRDYKFKVKLIHVNELNNFQGNFEQIEETFNEMLEDIEGYITHIEKHNDTFIIFYRDFPVRQIITE